MFPFAASHATHTGLASLRLWTAKHNQYSVRIVDKKAA